MTDNHETIKKLADIIEAHPDAQIEVDNDAWWIYDGFPDFDETGYAENEIASSQQFKARSNWYGFGNQYGHLVVDALVELLNRKGFNIKASAV
jgi:hypothetical protein